MKYRCEGTITVFLSLILTLILSVIMSMTESAAYAASRMKCELATDMSLESVFAEYNRELLSRYDLYFIDTSYGGTTPSLNELKEHMKDYISYNIDPSKGTLSIMQPADFTALRLDSLDIAEASYASDAAGRVFKRQAIQAFEDMHGISAAKALAEKAGSLISDYDKSGIEDEHPDDYRNELEQRLNDIDYDISENPARNAFDDREGILRHVMNTGGLSDKTIDASDLISHRSIHKGTGLHGGSVDTESILSELMFDEYLIDKCTSYTDDHSGDGADYELEYILYGRNTDKANLRETVEKLMLLRYGADAMYVLTDMEKRNTVQLIAEIICALLFVPEAAEALTDLILLAWAYGESVSDVVRLLAGERVPLIKDDADWKMPLWGLLAIKANARPTGQTGSGFSYEDYLRVFLMAENKTTKCMRAMDIIEMNLRRTEGNKNFRMDGCVEYVSMTAVMTCKGRYELTIDRKMSYLSDF
ncbi:MAG: hypothetical protein IJV16_04860 [Lachnospiraceae bacterium]|nr:hypothetical protein [Lachnospiraceae bacterium]MBR1524144.1 hypothetical protein [Lachnospiraceae bacterium]